MLWCLGALGRGMCATVQGLKLRDFWGSEPGMW